jgi:hypothetical protein
MAYYITQDDYFNQKNPTISEELLNVIEVAALPLQRADYNDQVYKSSAPIECNYDNNPIEIKYTEIPVISPDIHVYDVDATGELFIDDTTGKITNTPIPFSAVEYAWGCVITVTSYAADYMSVVIGGYPLKVQGKTTRESRDDQSVIENGLLKYKFPDNHLIQDRFIAGMIAARLIDTYKDPRKDIQIDWRGDPALELNDTITCTIYKKHGINTVKSYYIYKQVLTYDGGVRQKTYGRIAIDTANCEVYDTFCRDNNPEWIDFYHDGITEEKVDIYQCEGAI